MLRSSSGPNSTSTSLLRSGPVSGPRSGPTQGGGRPGSCRRSRRSELPAFRACQCTNRTEEDYTIQRHEVLLDVSGQQDVKAGTFNLELKPAPGVKVSYNFTVTTSAGGNERGGSYTEPFDWFDCSQFPKVKCSASARALKIKISLESVHAKDGQALLPKLDPAFQGEVKIHLVK